MSIIVKPNELIRKYAPDAKIKKLITQGLTVNKAVLKAFSEIDFIDKKEMNNVILKALKFYKKKFKTLKTEGESKAVALSEALSEKNLLVNRVQNLVIFQIASEIKSTYQSEFFKWLPSDAMEPDPEHQLNYGKVFQIGVDEMPGDRFGCRCGMEILVSENKLEL